jgi:hypothetical protein
MANETKCLTHGGKPGQTPAEQVCLLCAIEGAVAAERERCARVIETQRQTVSIGSHWDEKLKQLAQRIREG